MWKPPRRKTNQTVKTPANIPTELSPQCQRMVMRLKKVIQLNIARDAEIRRLLQNKPKPLPAGERFSIDAVYRADMRLGRTISYYDLEEECLFADAPQTIYGHNREIIMQEIFRRRREIIHQTVRDFWPLQTLGAKEKNAVLRFFGISDGDASANKGSMPTDTATTYMLSVKTPIETDYDDDPDEEILEAMESWKKIFPEDALRKASIIEVGGIQPGMKLNTLYGSGGGKGGSQPVCEAAFNS